MDFLSEIFQYRFLSNAVIASILAGIACGIIGTYIVSRRLVFLSGGITHSSFGGIGMAYYMGLNPIAGAFVFAVLSAIGMAAVTQKGQMREDSAIGILWSVGMAVGIIFIALTPGYAPNLMSLLFGNILTIGKTDLVLMLALDVILISIMILMYRPILYISFDREYAASQNLPVKFIGYLMMILTASTIVVSIRMVGIVLLISLLTFPPVIVNSLSGSYKRITLFSILISVLGLLTGLFISYKTNIPSGASTIIVLTITLIIVRITAYFLKKD